MQRIAIYKLRLASFFLLMCIASAATPYQGNDGAPASATRPVVHVTQVAILEDASGDLSFSEAESSFAAGQFEQLPQPLLNRGTTDAVYWLRLTLQNPQPSGEQLVLSLNYAPLDDVQLYARGESGELLHEVRGDSVKQADDAIRSRLPVFALTLPPHATQPVYVRVASTSNMNLEYSLWSPEQFQAREFRLNMVYGLFFGGIAATVLYLLYAARMAREPNALLLAAYLTAYGVYLAFLTGFPSLWLPASLIGHINALHLVSLGMLFGLGALFYRRFLQLATYGPRFDRVVAVLQWAGFTIVLAPLLPLPLVAFLLLVVAGPGPILTTAYAYFLWYQRREFAAVFAIGWSVAHFSSFLGTLRVSGVLPNSDFLLHLPAVGCAVACGFFTWAIARRLARERMYAYTDYLTGLANRRRFVRQGEIEFDRAKRYGRSLSLLMVDVDHFKQVNDTWGHGFGDKVLQSVAGQSERLSRDSDLVARIGGEEFSHLLIETGFEDARTIAERLLEAQSTAQVDGQSITVSIGVVTLQETDESFQSLVDRADQALYEAKKNGRNCVHP